MATHHLIPTTRIPEGRAIEGLEYGAHFARQGWTGYHVRPAGSGLSFDIARQAPAADGLEESDAATVEAIRAEVEHFARWAEHYGYDPASHQAVVDYREARENLAALEGVAERQETGSGLSGLRISSPGAYSCFIYLLDGKERQPT